MPSWVPSRWAPARVMCVVAIRAELCNAARIPAWVSIRRPSWANNRRNATVTACRPAARMPGMAPAETPPSQAISNATNTAITVMATAMRIVSFAYSISVAAVSQPFANAAAAFCRTGSPVLGPTPTCCQK